MTATGVEPDAWGFLIVSVPIVVIFAPLGSILSSHFHRQVLAYLIYILDTIALVSELNKNTLGNILLSSEYCLGGDAKCFTTAWEVMLYVSLLHGRWCYQNKTFIMWIMLHWLCNWLKRTEIFSLPYLWQNKMFCSNNIWFKFKLLLTIKHEQATVDKVKTCTM